MVDQITGEKPVGVNRFALQCAIVASIVSIIFGYGKYLLNKFPKITFLAEDHWN